MGLILLADDSKEAGRGHMTRCEAIHSSFLLQGHRSDLRGSDLTLAELQSLIQFHCNDDFKIFLVDRYTPLPDRLQSEILTSGFLVGIFADDPQLIPFKEYDYVIGFAHTLSKLRSSVKLQVPCDGYAFSLRPSCDLAPSQPSNPYVFVSIGADDYCHIAEPIIQVILNMTRFDVVYASLSAESCFAMSKRFSDTRLTCLDSESNIQPYMASSVLSITNAGQTSLQALDAGSRLIAISLNESQDAIGHWLSSNDLSTVIPLHMLQADSAILAESITRQLYQPPYDKPFIHQNYIRPCHQFVLELIAKLSSRYYADTINYPGFASNQVISEYEENCSSSEDYRRNRWGSIQSMTARHALLCQLLDSYQANSWLDIGCGTGEAQLMFRMRNNLCEIYGVDITETSITSANNKGLPLACFECIDIFQPPHASTITEFDFISMIGVASKTSSSLSSIIDCITSYMAPGSYFLFDIPNKSWTSIVTGELFPDNHHLWFDPSVINALIEETPDVEITEAWGLTYPNHLACKIEIADLVAGTGNYYCLYLLLRKPTSELLSP